MRTQVDASGQEIGKVRPSITNLLLNKFLQVYQICLLTNLLKIIKQETKNIYCKGREPMIKLVAIYFEHFTHHQAF